MVSLVRMEFWLRGNNSYGFHSFNQPWEKNGGDATCKIIPFLSTQSEVLQPATDFWSVGVPKKAVSILCHWVVHGHDLS